MKKFGLLTIVIVGLFVLGCTCPDNKPAKSGKAAGSGDKDTKAKAKDPKAAEGDKKEAGKDTPDKPKKDEGDKAAATDPADLPPALPDTLGTIEREVGKTGEDVGAKGPKIIPPKNKPDEKKE